MKTKHLLTCLAFLLSLAVSIPAQDSNTNTCRRSCCQAAPAATPLSPLPGKSLYQLENVWTNDQNEAVQLSALKGRPQVVVMFFANCQYACPILVFQLKHLEETLPAAVRANVGFTLVSFDSKRDTPAALKNYRAQHELGQNWTLLDGDPDAVQDLAAALGINFKEDAQGQFSHSNVITLLNSSGEIAYQAAGLNSDNDTLIQQIKKLEGRQP